MDIDETYDNLLQRVMKDDEVLTFLVGDMALGENLEEMLRNRKPESLKENATHISAHDQLVDDINRLESEVAATQITHSRGFRLLYGRRPGVHRATSRTKIRQNHANSSLGRVVGCSRQAPCCQNPCA